MSLIEIFSIILIHWFADFVLQTDKQARGKSKNWDDLLSHTFNYSLVWYVFGTLWSITSNIYTNYEYLFNWWIVWKFSIITFILHTITDYFTSKLNSKLLPKRELVHCYDDINVWKINKNESWHKFFVSVGFDQVLHYVQLFTTYYLLTK